MEHRQILIRLTLPLLQWGLSLLNTSLITSPYVFIPPSFLKSFSPSADPPRSAQDTSLHLCLQAQLLLSAVFLQRSLNHFPFISTSTLTTGLPALLPHALCSSLLPRRQSFLYAYIPPVRYIHCKHHHKSLPLQQHPDIISNSAYHFSHAPFRNACGCFLSLFSKVVDYHSMPPLLVGYLGIDRVRSGQP